MNLLLLAPISSAYPPPPLNEEDVTAQIEINETTDPSAKVPNPPQNLPPNEEETGTEIQSVKITTAPEDEDLAPHGRLWIVGDGALCC